MWFFTARSLNQLIHAARSLSNQKTQITSNLFISLCCSIQYRNTIKITGNIMCSCKNHFVCNSSVLLSRNYFLSQVRWRPTLHITKYCFHPSHFVVVNSRYRLLLDLRSREGQHRFCSYYFVNCFFVRVTNVLFRFNLL